MGGSTSKTRKLSVENTDPNGVIKLSDDVVDRIRGSQVVRPRDAPSWGGYAGPHAGSPINLFEPSLTTIQLRQENVENLQKNDDYWQKRIRALEAAHRRTDLLLEEEYEKARNEFASGNPQKASVATLPCADVKDAVLKCYKDNSKEPMKCAEVVKEFQECVDKKRICIVAKQKG